MLPSTADAKAEMMNGRGAALAVDQLALSRRVTVDTTDIALAIVKDNEWLLLSVWGEHFSDADDSWCAIFDFFTPHHIHGIVLREILTNLFGAS